MKKIVSALLFIVFNLIIAGACLEVYVRYKHGPILDFKAGELQYRRGDFVFDHSFIPNARAACVTKEWNVPYAINSFGFRDREFSEKKPEGTTRILALGDSYVEGFGVRAEQSFIKLFEKKMNEAPGKRFEVINGAIASYSPILEYLLLRHKLDKINPDIVLLVYDVGDLKDDTEYEKTVTMDADGKPVSAAPFERAWVSNATPFQRFLIKYLRGYLYLDNKLNKYFFKQQNRHRHFQDEYTDTVHHDSFIAYRGDQDASVRILWQKNRKYLGMIADLLKERGIRLILVSYPYGFQMHPEEWATGRLTQGFEAHKVYPEPKMLADVAAFAKERDVPFLDLYESFKARYSFPVQFPYDGHLNENGHRIMAEALADEMAKLGI